MVHVRKVQPKEPAKVERVPRGTTTNGYRIIKFMKTHKVKGNFRDHVLLIGDQLLDNAGTWGITRAGDVHGTVALVHKSSLREVIGEEAAAKFWDTKHKRRMPLR